jgi:hypothetical protein
MSEDRDLPRSEAPREDLGVSYARRVFSDVLHWYRSADTKAQVLLTIDGIFLSFLTGAIFSKPEDLAAMTQRFAWPTWVLLTLMCLTLNASIVSAIMCLWSRVHSGAAVRALFTDLRVLPEDASTYAPPPPGRTTSPHTSTRCSSRSACRP